MTTGGLRRWLMPLLVVGAVLAGGCTTTNDIGETDDQFEIFNRDAFEMNRGLDDLVLRPVSSTYAKVTPNWMRQAVFNFFRNAAGGGVAINQILQGKFEQGLEDFQRFWINTTFGLGGLVDFAGAIGLEAHQEDFDQTLAVWGVPSGPYLELPFLGPHTVRSALMILPNSVVNPTWWIPNPAGIALSAVELTEDRARVEGAIRLRDETALDPYVFQREGFLQRRRSLIFDGNPPLDDFAIEDDLLEDDLLEEDLLEEDLEPVEPAPEEPPSQ